MSGPSHLDRFGGGPVGGASDHRAGGPRRISADHRADRRRTGFGGPPGLADRRCRRTAGWSWRVWRAAPMPGPGGFPDPDAFGPGMFIAPVFVNQGDTNKDQRLSADELLALGRQWFDAWDVQHADVLDMRQHSRRTQRDHGASRGFWSAGRHGSAGWAAGGPAACRTAKMSFRGPEGKRNGVVAVMGMDFPSVHADLDFEGQTVHNVSCGTRATARFCSRAARSSGR